MTPGDITVGMYQTHWEHIRNGDRVMLACELNDLYVEELEDMPVKEAEQLLLTTDVFFMQLPQLPVTYIEVGGHTFSLCSFPAMEFGAFIDIEYYIKNDHILNLHNILSILYRLPQPTEPLSEKTIEPYGDWVSIRGEMFRQKSLYEVYGAVHSYVKYRERIFRTYKGLFSSEEDGPDDEPEVRMTSEEIKQRQKEQRTKKWGYELLLFRLAKGDPLQLKSAASLTITEALNILSMMEELQIN